MKVLLVLALLLATASCGTNNVQCAKDSNCDSQPGGRCSMSETGDKWCSYPSPDCPSGYRYSTMQVGDGVAGMCVAMTMPPPNDGGIDSGSGVPPGAFASCANLNMTCGATGTDSCCASLLVPGGTYFRSFDATNLGNMMFPATVSDFRLDKYEVTIGRFRAFVEAGMGTQLNPPLDKSGAHAEIPGSGWDAAWDENLPTDTAALVQQLDTANQGLWTDTPSVNDSRALVGVLWYEAMAFCIWDGGYLASDAQWGYAYAGGSDQRAYPWSVPATDTSVDLMHASYATGSPLTCSEDGDPACTTSDVVRPGTLPQGDARWGQSDMMGNVNEWVLDWYWLPSQTPQTATHYQLPCMDCANLVEPSLTDSQVRYARGGAYNSDIRFLRPDGNAFPTPPNLNPTFGIRCARSAQ